ncbi:MAG: hypothetical protein C0514_02455 [Candidatus Puniceispirillum sp.]|nr:hypothetical protein [Candidatus Puniceispirillum sp.]
MHNNLFKTMSLATALVSVGVNASPLPDIPSEAMQGYHTSPAVTTASQERSAIETLNLLESGDPQTRVFNTGYAAFLSAAHRRQISFLENGTLDPVTTRGLPAVQSLFGSTNPSEVFARGMLGLFSWAARMASLEGADSQNEGNTSGFQGFRSASPQRSAIETLNLLRDGSDETRNLNRAYAVFLGAAHGARIGVAADGNIDPMGLSGLVPISLFGFDAPNEHFAHGLLAVLRWGASFVAEQPAPVISPLSATTSSSPEHETEDLAIPSSAVSPSSSSDLPLAVEGSHSLTPVLSSRTAEGDDAQSALFSRTAERDDALNALSARTVERDHALASLATLRSQCEALMVTTRAPAVSTPSAADSAQSSGEASAFVRRRPTPPVLAEARDAVVDAWHHWQDMIEDRHTPVKIDEAYKNYLITFMSHALAN